MLVELNSSAKSRSTYSTASGAGATWSSVSVAVTNEKGKNLTIYVEPLRALHFCRHVCNDNDDQDHHQDNE